MTRKNKRKRTPETSVIIKEPIQEPVNPRKREKEGTITDVEKIVLKQHLHLFDTRYTTKVITMKRIVVLMIHQLILMIV